VEEIVLKSKGQLFSKRIAVRVRGMLAQQFGTAGELIMIGNTQMDTVEP
jgi:hypothetical protein